MRPNGKGESQGFHGKPGENETPASPRGGKQQNRCQDKQPAREEKQKACELHSRSLRFINIELPLEFVAACRVYEPLRLWLWHTIRKRQTMRRPKKEETARRDQALRLPGEQAYCHSGPDQKPFSITFFAMHVYIGQKIHFYHPHATAFTYITTPAFYIE